MKRALISCGEFFPAISVTHRSLSRQLKSYVLRLSLILLLTLFLSTVKGQNIHFSAGIEKTATRCLYGAGLTFETKSKWGLGGFYQAGVINNAKESLKFNDAFYGLLLQIPLAKTPKIDFFATARLGMVNEDFFAAVPGLETRIKLWRRLSTTFGMGYRVGYPSIGVKVSHPLF